MLSTHFETPHTIRVGWLSPGDLSDVEEVVHLPAALSPVKVADDGTPLAEQGRGALAVTYTPAGGIAVRALTAIVKSKLLSFPGGRFDTDDEAERARYGVYALDRRAAEASAVRDWATTALAPSAKSTRPGDVLTGKHVKGRVQADQPRVPDDSYSFSSTRP